MFGAFKYSSDVKTAPNSGIGKAERSVRSSDGCAVNYRGER